MKYKIYEENGHLGIMDEDGKKISPPVYDEIDDSQKGEWYCRAYIHWDRLSLSTGKINVEHRQYYACSTNAGEPISRQDRAILDDYDSYIDGNNLEYIYRNGKFGFALSEDNVVLPPIYDCVRVWKGDNVIGTRKGKEYKFFDFNGEEILQDFAAQFFHFCGLSDPAIGRENACVIVQEFVNGEADGFTYENLSGDKIRAHYDNIKEHIDSLAKNSERIPMPQRGINDYTDEYSYEYGTSAITIKIDSSGGISSTTWHNAIKKLQALNSFDGRDWHYTDKFLTNSKTMLPVSSFYNQCLIYDKMSVLGDLNFAYGIDDSLADGEVRWIHAEHYNEHCFPPMHHYDVGNIMDEGTLEELKEAIESYDWEAEHETPGGAFFHFSNLNYSKNREWQETERVLEYMCDECGKKPKDLIKTSIEALKEGVKSEGGKTFYINCIKWALERCSFPNEIRYKTCYDIFHRIKHKFTSEMFDELDTLFRQHGALTAQEVKEKFDDYVSTCDPYDYSIVNNWDMFF